MTASPRELQPLDRARRPCAGRRARGRSRATVTCGAERPLLGRVDARPRPARRRRAPGARRAPRRGRRARRPGPARGAAGAAARRRARARARRGRLGAATRRSRATSVRRARAEERERDVQRLAAPRGRQTAGSRGRADGGERGRAPPSGRSSATNRRSHAAAGQQQPRSMCRATVVVRSRTSARLPGRRTVRSIALLAARDRQAHRPDRLLGRAAARARRSR